MDISVNLSDSATADGEYKVLTFADDYVCLFWGDSHDILEDYTPLFVVTVVDGDGVFRLYGNRAVPPEATEIYARSYYPNSPERSYCYYTYDIPAREKEETGSCIYRISLLSDLHLSKKDW